jgi:gliding motility-associated-like protein
VSGEAIGTSAANFTQTLTNNTTVAQTVTYTLTPTSGDTGNCVGSPFTVTITVNPTPVIADKELLICSGDTFNFTLTDGLNGDRIPAGTKYTWTVVSNPNITGAVNQTVPQNSIAISQALVNTGTTPEVVTYQVTPTSATGCAGASFNLVVTVKSPIVINGQPHSYNGFGISCFGANDGYIELNPTGGKLPADPAGYTYSWTGPNGFTSTAQNIYNLVPGAYTVNVGEGSGLCTQTKTFQVTEPQPLAVTSALSNYNGFEISCFGATDGSITLSVTGGTSTYTYLWTPSNGGLIPAGMQTAANLTGVRAGTYSVKILDANGCEKIETYVLRQPAPVGISEVGASRKNVLCFGEATGNITVIGSGGVKEYTYSVNGTDYTGAAVSLTSGPTNLNLHSFSTLKAGQYTLTITDLNGCQKSLLPITITQPLAPIQVTNSVLSNFNGFNVACFGDSNGSITHQVSGGTAPYRYLWTGPNGFTSTSLNVTNLAAGNYQLTITDASNCTFVKPYQIVSPDPIDVDAVKQNVLCGGELTGNIFIRNVTGGTGVYESLWIKDGVGEIKRSRTPEDLRNIGPGRYILLVTDQNFCEYIEVFDVTEPVALVTTVAKKENNLCFGDSKGSIQINVTGGTGPYTYAWTGTGGFTSTNKDLTGLISGSYQVVVTDALLCTSTLSVTITQPTEIVVNPTLTMVSCPDGKDGSISMTVAGGVPPYVYAWVGPNGFRSATRDLTGLSAGTYELLITDGIGCKITRTYEITDPEPIVLTPTISNFNGFEISCKGGSDGVIDLKITGGNEGYRIFWEGPNGFRSNLSKIERLFPGLYEVTVIDSKNCISKATYTLDAPEELSITRDDIQITDVSCFDGQDGTLTVTIKKASVGPYRYELSGSSVSGFPVSESILSNNLTYQFTGLRAGSYTLRVSDANGCALSELSGLVVTQPSAALSFTIQKTDVACYRANNGTIRVTPAGGTAPYTIRWNNLSTSFTLQNLSPGTYTATITDAKGCTVGVSSTVAEAPVYDLQEVVKNISCFGKKDGSIQLNIIGGKAPIKIQWAHGPQEPTLNNLEKGIYSVVITDAGGCKIERQFVINEPQALDLSSTVTDALDCDDPNTGSISVTPFGGTPPYTYTWSNGARTQNLAGIAPGSYSLELVDAMGCRILRQFTVIRPLPLTATVVRTSERICSPRGIKSNFKVSVTGGVAPYTVSWNRGTQTNGGLTMDTQELGVFIVTVTDSRGCIQTKRMEVIETDPLIPEFDYKSASFDFSYENLVNFEIQFDNLSIGKYKEVTWDFGDGGSSLEWEPKHTYAKSGTYIIELKLRDLDGCVVSFTKEIVITDHYLEFPNIFSPNDDSINDHFYPKFIYIKDIQVLIMNKWGELIFESKDLESKGWDGKYNGEKASIGNYVVKVRYTTLDGRVFERSSVFYLAR